MNICSQKQKPRPTVDGRNSAKQLRLVVLSHHSGQIIATSHGSLTTNGGEKLVGNPVISREI